MACMKPLAESSLSLGELRFHPICLSCVTCGKKMQGLPITLDSDNKIYCTADYDRCEHVAIMILILVFMSTENSVQNVLVVVRKFYQRKEKQKPRGCELKAKIITWPVLNVR